MINRIGEMEIRCITGLQIFDFTGKRLDNFPINQTHIVVYDFDKKQLIKYRDKFPV